MKLLAPLLIALFATGCVLSEPDAVEGEVDGPTLYLDRCESCHGYDGRGTDAGPDLRWRVQGMTVDEVADVVLFGEGLMSPVDLDEAEATEVAGFTVNELFAL